MFSELTVVSRVVKFASDLAPERVVNESYPQAVATTSPCTLHVVGRNSTPSVRLLTAISMTTLSITVHPIIAVNIIGEMKCSQWSLRKRWRRSIICDIIQSDINLSTGSTSCASSFQWFIIKHRNPKIYLNTDSRACATTSPLPRTRTWSSLYLRTENNANSGWALRKSPIRWPEFRRIYCIVSTIFDTIFTKSPMLPVPNQSINDIKNCSIVKPERPERKFLLLFLWLRFISVS